MIVVEWIFFFLLSRCEMVLFVWVENVELICGLNCVLLVLLRVLVMMF